MPTYMTELLDRCVALQKEAMASISVACDAKPYFFHWQEKGPYFTNRIPTMGIATDGSEVEDLNQPTVIMRLVIGHLTESYRGIPESKLYEWMPVVKTYFQQRMWLQTATGPYAERMENLLPPSRIVNIGAIGPLNSAGINQIQVGCEFALSCTFYEHIEQVYY